MPWNNNTNGGGPWGSPPGGGNNPWGRQGSGGGGGSGGGAGPQPPNLDDLIRKGQDSVKKFMPGGLGGGGRGLILVGIVLLLVWLASGIYRVQANQQGVVLRFGEYVRTAGPGLHYHLPTPIEAVETPEVTSVRKIEIGFQSAGVNNRGGAVVRDLQNESLMVTGDENIIDVDFVVLWKIKDAGQYLFNIRAPEETIKTVAESAMRETIGQTDIQPALTEARQQIEQNTRDVMQSLLDAYQSGIEITDVQLQKVDPPQPVIDAFDDVQRARQDRDRLRNQSEAYRNDIIPRARGEAEQMLQEAQAYREEVIARANGQAERFISIYQAYSVSKDVTAQRLYLETMEEVFRNSQKVIIDSGTEGAQGVVPYLPLNELRRPGAAGQN